MESITAPYFCYSLPHTMQNKPLFAPFFSNVFLVSNRKKAAPQRLNSQTCVPNSRTVTLPACCTWHNANSITVSIEQHDGVFLLLPLRCFVFLCRQDPRTVFAMLCLALQAGSSYCLCNAVSCLQVDNVKQLSQGVKASMAAFWTPERLHQLCRTLAYHFITLTVLIVLHGSCPGVAQFAEQ